MAILNLTGSEAEVLRRIIAAENPQFNDIPDSFKFGTPIPGVAERTTINILGLPGTTADALVSGIQTMQYSRIDLTHMFVSLKPLNVYGCVTTRDVLHNMHQVWGIDIDPNFIVDEALVLGSGSVTLTYQNHNRVLLGDSVTLQVRWSDSIDISLVFKDKYLDGFALPWPYLQDVRDLFSLSKLDGFIYPSLSLDLATLSVHWTIDDAETAAWAAGRVQNGPYARQTLVEIFNRMAPVYPWKFIDSEISSFNLWGSVIESNEPSDIMPGYTHALKIRVNTTYFHDGVGTVTLHYKQ